MHTFQIIKGKYKNVSLPMKASFWFIVSNIFLKGISFITMPIFTRILTPSDYGVMSLYQSWISLFSIFMTLTVWGGYFSVGMVKYLESQAKLISVSQGIGVSVSAVWILLLLIFRKFVVTLLGMSDLLLFFLCIEVLVTIPFNLWSTAQKFTYKYKTLILIIVINSILNPAIGYLAVVNSEHKVEARIISSLMIQLILGVIFFIYNLSIGKVFFEKKLWKIIIKFDLVLIPHYLALQLLSHSDRIMIDKLCGNSKNGLYSIAYTFAMLLSLITNGVESSVTPYMYKLLRDKENKKLPNFILILSLIVGILSLLMILVLPTIIRFMLPDSYLECIDLLPTLLGGVFFMFFYPMFASIEFFYGENKYVTIASFFTSFLNIIINYFFIKLFDYRGAAYSTLLCYVFLTLFHFFFMRKVLKKNHSEDFFKGYLIICYISVYILLIVLIQCCYFNITFRIIMLFTLILIVFLLRKTIMDILK